MNKEPLISVIIPCYNVEEFLYQCVESVRNQSYSNLEIILVDDGSTDKTSEICDELARIDSRIVVLHKQNGGVSQARNAGMEIAAGAFVMFIDGDDWIDVETCEQAMYAALQHKVDIVIWSYIREFASRKKPKLLLGTERKYFDISGVNLLQRRIVGLTGQELANPEHADSLVTVWGKLYRKDVVDGISFLDMSEIGTEDVYYNMLAFGKAQSAFYLPECYHHYRKTNTKSLSTAYTWKIFSRWKNLYKKIDEYIENNKKSQDFRSALNNRICLGLIGLGTNLEQSSESIRHKFDELNLVLSDPVYREAINQLEFCYLPLKWKVFFFFAKHRIIPCLYLMLYMINCIRRA